MVRISFSDVFSILRFTVRLTRFIAQLGSRRSFLILISLLFKGPSDTHRGRERLDSFSFVCRAPVDSTGGCILTIPFSIAEENQLDSNSWIAVRMRKIEMAKDAPPLNIRRLPLRGDCSSLTGVAPTPSRDFTAKVHVLKRAGQKNCFRFHIPSAVLGVLKIPRESIIEVQCEKTGPPRERSIPHQKLFCRMCGLRLRSRDRFCDQCGAEVF